MLENIVLYRQLVHDSPTFFASLCNWSSVVLSTCSDPRQLVSLSLPLEMYRSAIVMSQRALFPKNCLLKHIISQWCVCFKQISTAISTNCCHILNTHTYDDDQILSENITFCIISDLSFQKFCDVMMANIRTIKKKKNNPIKKYIFKNSLLCKFASSLVEQCEADSLLSTSDEQNSRCVCEKNWIKVTEKETFQTKTITPLPMSL